MYKAGKKWTFAVIAGFSVVIGSATVTNWVYADTGGLSAPSSVVTSSSVSSSGKISTSSNNEPKKSSELTSISKSSTTNKYMTKKDHKTANKAVSNGNKTGKKGNTPIKLTYQYLINRAGIYLPDSIHVNRDNFLNYFKLEGDAIYDENKGVVTLVPDVNNRVGNLI